MVRKLAEKEVVEGVAYACQEGKDNPQIASLT